jgi:hypothetical protein
VLDQNAVVWKLAGFPEQSQGEIAVVATCLPISAEFDIPMFSGSGLALRYLSVF